MVIDIYVFNSQGTQSLICLVSLINQPNIYRTTWLWSQHCLMQLGHLGCSLLSYRRKNLELYPADRRQEQSQGQPGVLNTDGQVKWEKRTQGDTKATNKCLCNTEVTSKGKLEKEEINVHLFTL